jgi:lysozyme
MGQNLKTQADYPVLNRKQTEEVNEGLAPYAIDLEQQSYAARVCADNSSQVTLGIDVSRWQGDIDWRAVAGDGVKFAVIRVSDGLNAIDQYFEANWAGARDNGILRSTYQFFRPSQDPIAQADLLLDKLNRFGQGDLPPVIDVEATDNLSPAQVRTAVDAWINHVEGRLGVKPIIYTGAPFWNNNVQSNRYESYPLWLAAYPYSASCLRPDTLLTRLVNEAGLQGFCPNIPDAWNDWYFWQYSSSGCVAGIDGDVDMNIYNGTYEELLNWANPPDPVCGDQICYAAERSTCYQDCPICPVPAEGAIIDNVNPQNCFEAGGGASGIRRVSDDGYEGNLVWTRSWISDQPDNYGQWHLTFLEAGKYLVEAYTDASYAEWTQTPYQVMHQGVKDVSVVDQTAVDGWQVVGTFDFAQGGDQWIRIDDNVDIAPDPNYVKKQMVFDAIRFTRVMDPIPNQDMSVMPANDMQVVIEDALIAQNDMQTQPMPIIDQNVVNLQDQGINVFDRGISVFVDARVNDPNLNPEMNASTSKGDNGCQMIGKSTQLNWIWGILMIAYFVRMRRFIQMH